MATPPNIQQLYQSAGDATAAYARGFSDMMENLAATEAQQGNQLLGLIGSPAQLPTQYQPLGDVLYGYSGYIPGSTLAQEGAGWGAAMSALPGIYDAQSQQRAAEDQRRFSMELQAALDSIRASAASSASSGGGGGGGATGGLTAYQSEQLARNDRDFEYQVAQDQLDYELKVAQAEQDQAMQAGDSQYFGLLTLGLLNPDLQDDPKWINALAAAAGFGGSSGLSTLAGITGDAADAAATAQANRNRRRQALRADITGFDLGPYKNQQKAVTALTNQIRTNYPNLAGMGEKQVQTLIRNYVSSNWAGRGGGGGGGGSGAQARKEAEENYMAMKKLANSYWEDIKEIQVDVPGNPFASNPSEREDRSVTRTISYRTAFARMYGQIKDEFTLQNGRWVRGLNDKNVRQYIRTFLKRQGLRQPPRGGGAAAVGGAVGAGVTGVAGAITPRRTTRQPSAAERNRAAQVRRLAAAQRTQAQKNFLRRYNQRYG